MRDLSSLPGIVFKEFSRYRIEPDGYPGWLLDLAEAWWAVLPPTRCAVRQNGDEAIIDTLARSGSNECNLRLDWVECRVRLNGHTFLWSTAETVDPEPARGFYTAFDGKRRLTGLEGVVLATVIGELARLETRSIFPVGRG